MTGYFKPSLICDGIELAQIENGTYFQVSAPVGVHHCTAESLQRPILDVNVPAAGTIYVHVKMLSGWHDHVVLLYTTEAEYRKEQAKLKPLKEWSRDNLMLRSSGDATESPGLAEAVRAPLGAKPEPERYSVPALTGRQTHTDTATINVIVKGEHAALDCYEHRTGCTTIGPGKYYGEFDGESLWIDYEMPLTHKPVRNHYKIAGSW